MKIFILNILSLFFPWLVFLMTERFGAALLALFMQMSLIGWLPATVWAWRVVQEMAFEQKMKARNKQNDGNTQDTV